MRRALVAGSSSVILALAGVLAAGVGARTVRHAASRSVVVSPSLRAPAVRGSTCLVSIPRCSQRPCVELIGSHASQSVAAVASIAAVARTRIVTPRPTPTCGPHRSLSPQVSVTVTRPSARPPDPFRFAPRLKRMAAQLAGRHR